MSKKRNKMQGELQVMPVAESVSVVVTAQPRARSRTFTAKPCTACTSIREPDTNFTRVFATRGNVRYCRCHYCGNTWKDSDAVPHSGNK